MRWIVRLTLMIAAAFALSACHENGTVFTVDTAVDAPDANPGDGLCATAGGGCTLRAAIMEANALPGVERIENDGIVPRSFIPAPTPEDDPAVGDYDITDQVVIDNLVIDLLWLGASTDQSQLFDIAHPSGLVEFRGLDALTTFVQTGTAFRLRGAGSLLIEDARFTHWDDSTGSMIESDGGSGALIVVRGQFSGLPPRRDTRGVVANGSSLTVTHSSFSNLALGIDASSTTAELRYVSLLDNAVGLRGSAAVQSSVIGRNGQDCENIVQTLGLNVERGTSCGFTAATDEQSAHVRYLRGFTLGFDPTYWVPAVGSVGHEPPTSTSACNGSDALGVARPQGAACEIGAIETIPWAGCSLPIGQISRSRFCDLPGIDLSGTNLSGSDLAGGRFAGANFTNASVQVDFESADLNAANFTNALALGADFSWADLTTTIFTGANSRNADFSDALLIGTDFTDADLTDAVLDNATMTGVVWSNTICPSGVNSDANGGNCDGQF
ncbi:MAG: pentapeptide repeat-containing protein [Actinomycetota bacterium]